MSNRMFRAATTESGEARLQRESLLGSTLRAASERAPTEAASLNIDGSATGIEDKIAARTSA
jgi:hypothetical protein